MLEVLGTGSNVAEVLWNFSRCKGDKRITLKQNPHFYKLPESKDAYGTDFRSDPMESFVDTTKVHVLTDRPGRIYLDSGQDTRAFGNVWRPKDAIIFKGSCLIPSHLPFSTSLQTFAANSRAKVLWEHRFKATLT